MALFDRKFIRLFKRGLIVTKPVGGDLGLTNHFGRPDIINSIWFEAEQSGPDCYDIYQNYHTEIKEVDVAMRYKFRSNIKREFLMAAVSRKDAIELLAYCEARALNDLVEENLCNPSEAQKQEFIKLFYKSHLPRRHYSNL